ncbi:hypothetical protein GCM10007423_63960 [Dyadobacter endophyticus]|uniref:Formamidopyrimidine-DNA glycosylase H2TH DNA-binding domain-containing protein n=1 Tax=Dyadobacter endophyticus TaxID=1749036 RepID=A0ABQ1ZCD8_9BACT|nr:DNA-formamidopyrimidine glycosylase family protein [Dyadobacter endophyticus]GGH55915.1 hypothetical protein GCM10007423_63960 [Dyadobacter endophyticus]
MIGIPELIILRQNLARRFAGQKINDLHIHWEHGLNEPAATIFAATINSSLLEVRRVGRLLHLVLDNGLILGIRVFEKARFYLLSTQGRENSPMFEIVFSSGDGFGVRDALGQSQLLLNPRLATEWDVLHPSLTFSYLKKVAYLRKNEPVKGILMKDPKLCGLGSAYIDEVLWEIGVAPQSRVGKIPEGKLRDLLPAIKNVLNRATESLSTLTGSAELITDRRDFLIIHNTGRMYDPKGFPIMRAVIHNRRTYWSESQSVFL